MRKIRVKIFESDHLWVLKISLYLTFSLYFFAFQKDVGTALLFSCLRNYLLIYYIRV